jgi:hypothetical protein
MLLTCLAPQELPCTGRGGATQRHRWRGVFGFILVDFTNGVGISQGYIADGNWVNWMLVTGLF